MGQARMVAAGSPRDQRAKLRGFGNLTGVLVATRANQGSAVDL